VHVSFSLRSVTRDQDTSSRGAEILANGQSEMAAKSSVLYAAAKEIGDACSVENRAFLACKAKDENPESCLAPGAAVQDCALSVLKSAMDACGATLSAHASCINNAISEEYMFDRCRTTEHAFQDCRTRNRPDAASVVAAKPSEQDSQPRTAAVSE
jgi:NADH dehydrogenase (ubiquinone) 1 alpha subcomplex subunit 8